MLYDLVGEHELLVTLSAVEICDYFGSFQELRYDNKESKTALGNILRQALCETDFNLSGERLFIKVRPRDDGGCTICFKITRKKGRTLYRTLCTYIYEFYKAEDMLLMCEQIKLHTKDNTFVSIYTKDGAYRLLIKEENINRAVLALGYEYCDRFYKDATETEKTKEHWHNICTNAPISKIINS